MGGPSPPTVAAQTKTGRAAPLGRFQGMNDAADAWALKYRTVVGAVSASYSLNSLLVLPMLGVAAPKKHKLIFRRLTERGFPAGSEGFSRGSLSWPLW